MFHALALLLVAAVPQLRASLAGWLFVAGTILFSGSLYALALTGVRALGAITPPWRSVLSPRGWALLVVAFSAPR